jgi:hypothetical protein
MTLTEIRNQLVSHLIKNDQFSLKNDSVNIKVSKNQESVKNDLIRISFIELEKNGLVMRSKIDSQKDEVWILESPLVSQGQDVGLSFSSAEAISIILNEFKEVLGNGKNSQPTNVLNITEHDIIQLVLLCRQLLEKQDK